MLHPQNSTKPALIHSKAFHSGWRWSRPITVRGVNPTKITTATAQNGVIDSRFTRGRGISNGQQVVVSDRFHQSIKFKTQTEVKYIWINNWKTVNPTGGLNYNFANIIILQRKFIAGRNTEARALSTDRCDQLANVRELWMDGYGERSRLSLNISRDIYQYRMGFGG